MYGPCSIVNHLTTPFPAVPVTPHVDPGSCYLFSRSSRSSPKDI